MTSLPDGDVGQFDVMRWAQEQAIYLSPPAAHHVLLYLCLNAFYKGDNPEGRSPGDVLSAYASMAKIQRYTGLSESSVRRALRTLEDNGYVSARMLPGKGKSEIGIFWTASADEMREEFRAGIRDLPKGMRRSDRVAPKKTPKKVDNVISVEFGTGHIDR